MFALDTSLSLVVAIFLGLIVLQVIVAVYVTVVLLIGSKGSKRINRETFGLLKKIEGLSAEKHERLEIALDNLLDDLMEKLPVTVAGRLGDELLQLENHVLRHLAEIDPDLASLEGENERVSKLLRSMERLEDAVVRAAADTVQRVLLEQKASIKGESVEVREAAC